MIKLFLLLTPFLRFSCKKPTISPEQPTEVAITHDTELLRRTLHQQCEANHTALNYRQLWEALRVIDGDGDSVRLIYSQEMRGKNLNGYCS